MILTKKQRLVAEHLAAYIKKALETGDLYFIDHEDGVTKRLRTIPGWLYDELMMTNLLGPNGAYLSYARLMTILDSLMSAKLVESSPEERIRILSEETDYVKSTSPDYHD